MSVSFNDKRFGVTFREVIVILESLEQISFEDTDKEKVRLSTIDYITTKLWEVYPYNCEQYFHENPTSDKFD